MAVQKIYAGAKLRELRVRLSLTQKVFAQKLGVSLPYLNQMENKNLVETYHMVGSSEFKQPTTHILSNNELL